MTAQEQCLQRSREYYLELCDIVHKAAITLSEKEIALADARKHAEDAWTQFNEAMARLRAYKGTPNDTSHT